MAMTSYGAFHSEIIKIAQDSEQRPPDRPGTITKERLKRLAIAAPVAAAGGALGHGVGQLVRRNVMTPAMLGKLQSLSQTNPWVAKGIKALPAVAGGLTAGAGALQFMKNRRVREYIEGKDGGRSEAK